MNCGEVGVRRHDVHAAIGRGPHLRCERHLVLPAKPLSGVVGEVGGFGHRCIGRIDIHLIPTLGHPTRCLVIGVDNRGISKHLMGRPQAVGPHNIRIFVATVRRSSRHAHSPDIAR